MHPTRSAYGDLAQVSPSPAPALVTRLVGRPLPNLFAPWTAEELGEVIRDAVEYRDDLGDPNWAAIARMVSEAIGLRLSGTHGPRALDIIHGRVNALGGYTDPKDPAAVAWAKEHAAVLEVIEDFGGRDPAGFADRTLTTVAHHRGADLVTALYGEGQS